MGALKRELESKRRVQIVEQAGVCKVDRVSSEILFDDAVAVETTREGGKVDEFHDLYEHLADVRGDGDSFEGLGDIGEKTERIGVVDMEEVERTREEVRLEGFPDVDEENAVSRVFEEKIFEHLTVDDEIVQEGGGDCDSFESSGTVIDNIEKIGIEGDSQVNALGNDHVVDDQVAGVSDEKIVEYLKVGDKIVEDFGADGDSFECSGGIGENTENIGIEGDIVVNSGSNDPVVDDEVAAQQMSEGSKIEEFVKHLGLNEDISESSESNDEKVESIGLADDIMVNLGTSNPVANYEMAVGEKSEGKKLEEFEEKINEHVGVENVGSENLGANVEIVENVGVGGVFKLTSCDDVDEDDDWEGVERSELEENFAAAASYVFYGDKNVCEPKLGSDVKMELYGLNKVALEGPCRESQPMAIMISARAKCVFLLNPATLECDLTGGSISVNKI